MNFIVYSNKRDICAVEIRKKTMKTMMVHTYWWRSYNSNSRKGSKPCVFIHP